MAALYEPLANTLEEAALNEPLTNTLEEAASIYIQATYPIGRFPSWTREIFWELSWHTTPWQGHPVTEHICILL